jgi:hypothetical protein
MKITKKQLIHCIATCCDCDFIEDDFLIAKKEAIKHYKKTNHIIIIDSGYYQKIN